MILFDFDGVLVDSVQEIAISAYNFIAGERKFALDQLPKRYVELFLANKHLMLSPSRLGFLARWCLSNDTGESFLSRENFFKYIELCGGEDINQTDHFYKTRQWFIDNHHQAWVKSNTPFPDVWSALKSYKKEIVILTYKNRAAVIEIAKYYSLNLIPENIYSGEGGKSKWENICEIDQRFKDTNYIFLDDALENLVTLTPAVPNKVRGVLATWGYNLRGDQSEAAKMGFELSSQKEFIERYLS